MYFTMMSDDVQAIEINRIDFGARDVCERAYELGRQLGLNDWRVELAGVEICTPSPLPDDGWDMAVRTG